MKQRSGSGRFALFVVLCVLAPIGWAGNDTFSAPGVTTSSEGLSKLDAEMSPDIIKRLPEVVRLDLMRDLFLYPEGLGKGRIIHMRVPDDNLPTEDAPGERRHSAMFKLMVMYPEMTGYSSLQAAKKSGPDGSKHPNGAMVVTLRSAEFPSLDDQLNQILLGMTKSDGTRFKTFFEAIPLAPGFSNASCVDCKRLAFRASERSGSEADLPGSSDEDVSMDVYTEYGSDKRLARLMWCTNVVLPLCSFGVKSDALGVPYGLNVGFQKSRLKELPEIVERFNAEVKKYIVDVF